jgi:hypothetical protein
MPQGMRSSWIRSIHASVGIALCVGLIGCNSTDKPKDPLGPKPVSAGLPGTTTLPATNGMPPSGTATTLTRPGTSTGYTGPSTGYTGPSTGFTGSSTGNTGSTGFTGSSTGASPGMTGSTGSFGSNGSSTGGMPPYTSTPRPTTPSPYSPTGGSGVPGTQGTTFPSTAPSQYQFNSSPASPSLTDVPLPRPPQP